MACDCSNLDWTGIDQRAAHHPACGLRDSLLADMREIAGGAAGPLKPQDVGLAAQPMQAPNAVHGGDWKAGTLVEPKRPPYYESQRDVDGALRSAGYLSETERLRGWINALAHSTAEVLEIVNDQRVQIEKLTARVDELEKR